MPHCFKRIRFTQCDACAPTLPHRFRCFLRYATWGTDPLPAEHMLGWIAFGMGLVMLLKPGMFGAAQFGVMFYVAPHYCWGVTAIAIGLSQLITPVFSMVPWVRCYRLIVAGSSGAFWTSIASLTAFHLGVVPFLCSTTIYAAASWWIFLRTPDAAPLRPAARGK